MSSNRAGGEPLMTAGRFGQVTMLSAKALRIYADRGLLSPRWVDPANGYRYYGQDQVRIGWLVALLRSADLSLDDVADIIAAPVPARAELLERAVEAERHRAEASLAVLARARHHLRGEFPMSDLQTRVETDRAVLSVLRRIRPDEMAQVIADQVQRLRALAAEAGLTIVGDPFGTFHAPVTEDSDGPLEISLPVDDLTDTAGDSEVRSYRLAGGSVAERDAEGSETDFPHILAIYDEVHTWITASGRVPVGPPREIWHNSPHDPGPLRLTISWPYTASTEPPQVADRP